MKKHSILLVEDDELDIISFRRSLKQLGSEYELHTAYNGKEALSYLSNNKEADKPDVILLDIHVKPFTGFEMLEMLRQSEHFAGTKIVALTASVMNEEVLQLKESSFDGCLSKPVDSDIFPDLLSQIVEGEEIWRITS